MNELSIVEKYIDKLIVRYFADTSQNDLIKKLAIDIYCLGHSHGQNKVTGEGPLV